MRNDVKELRIEDRVKKTFLHCFEGLNERESAYVQGAYDERYILTEKVDMWLRKHLPRVISNYPLDENVVTDMLNEDMRADLRKYLRNQ